MKLLTSVVAMVLARLSAGLVATAAAASPASPRCVMYLTGQHPVTPDAAQMARVSHVLLAFLPSDMFNGDAGDERTTWPLFTSVDDVRRRYPPGDADAAKVMVAIGGWGDTRGFSAAARSAASRRRFARNVARMVAATGADGIDVDWEYPGGNGEDYKQVPNGDKAWEVEAYPLLVAELRAALGPRKLLSAAVPGRPGDMLAFTRTTVPRIMNHVDFLNVMTYDLMNRRDNVTKHHTGLQDSIAGLDAYIQAGAAPQNLNLGFAFYTKWVKTEHASCLLASPPTHQKGSPIGCPTLLLEDPETGADLGRTGGFAWHDPVPEDLEASFARAKSLGRYDESGGGGYYYWDGEEDLWWTFDTPDAIARKFPAVVEEKKVGGVFAWGLGEDAPGFEHLAAVLRGLERHGAAAAGASKNEL